MRNHRLNYILLALALCFCVSLTSCKKDGAVVEATPTPDTVETQTPVVSEEPTPTAEPTETPTPTVEPTETPTPTVEPTETPTPTVEPTEAPTPTVEPTEAPTPTVEPTEAPTPTVEPTETPAPTVEPTETPTPTPKPTETPEQPEETDSDETQTEEKDWVGIVDIDKVMGGFTKNAKDLPHIAATIAETNAKVESGRGDFGARPHDAYMTQYIRLESHDSLDGSRKELWITGMTSYFGYEGKDYLKIIRAILEDTVSSSEDVEGIMELVNQMDAVMEIGRTMGLKDEQYDKANTEMDRILDNVHEFDTVVVSWGGESGYVSNVLRIWSK